MDDVGSTAGDDSLDLNSAPGKAASRGRKASSASKARPRSANSAMSAANSRKITGPGTAVTAKSRGKANRRQQAQGQGSRMRASGDGADKNAGSSSVPLLHPVISVVTPADTNGDRNNSVIAARSTGGSVDFGGGRRRRRTRNSTVSAIALNQQSEDDEKNSVIEAEDAARLLQQLESRNQEVELRCCHLENRCTQLEADASSNSAEFKSYKAEVRAKIIAVGKAEIILNEVCLLTARRVGLAEGTHISDNKGGILLEVHESPAEFAAQIKKNILAQLSKWEIDRAALQAVATSAGDKASEIAEVHQAECAELLARSEHLEERIREMELDSQRQVAESAATAEQSRRECEVASSEKEELVDQLDASETRNKELRQKVDDDEKEFQAQLDRFMEYPKAAEKMAEELDRCQKSARREKNLMRLERKEFRRQLHMFQKWHTENKDLREKAKLQEAQALALRRQLAVTESGAAGGASTRKAVIGGTVDRLQRAESAAKHQASKYRELAGTRGVQVAQLETEVSSLKATVKNLRLMQVLEPQTNDTYEMEIARLARVNPEILEIQQKSGLNKEDMQASMAQLKLLREKEEQKDALIGLARERDEFELCIKELRARNSWLEKQVLRSPEALRSVAQERVAAVSQSEEDDLARRRGVSNGGWTGAQNITSGGGGGGVGEGRGGGSRATAPPPTSKRGDAVSRLERRLDVHLGGRGKGGGGGATAAGVESTAGVRRTIKFLQDCDRSIERQREREASVTHTGHAKQQAGGSGGDAVHAVRGTSRQRPQSAQGITRRPSSTYEGGLFRGGVQ